MRIVFVSQIVPYPPHGGVLQRGFNLLREIGQRHQVHLLAYVHPDTLHHSSDLERSRLELGRFCEHVEYFPLWPKRSTLHRHAAYLAAIPYSKPFSVLAHYSIRLRHRLRKLVGQEPDLVHLDTIALAELKELCCDVPCILTHHNIESQLMARRAQAEATAFGRWFVRRQAHLLRTYEERHSRRFPLNVMVSQQDAIYLQSIAPGARTVVVENGVDVDYFRPLRGSEEQALIYAGGMNMFANRDAVQWFLRTCWPQLKRHRPQLKFLVIGQDPPAELLRMRDEDPSIEVPGFVDDVRPWIARAAVYVVPLRVGGGTRLKVVDAMAQGKAIVSTAVGCEGIHVTDGKELLVADAPDAFVASILRLLADPGERVTLGNNARSLAEDAYAWPHVAAKLLEAYERVVAETRSGTAR